MGCPSLARGVTVGWPIIHEGCGVVRDWNPVTVWIPPSENGTGVREPLRPLPPVRTNHGHYDEQQRSTIRGDSPNP